jgi:outer membrane protein OmpA-like peptidoglycan-associated protein
LALKWEVGDKRLQVIRLSYPETVTTTAKEGDPVVPAKPPGGTPASAASMSGNAAAGTAKRIEEDLAKDGRSIIYGIYFDFASDRIKEESEPVLSEIAQVLRDNPTWNLNVEGHTDSIGSDADNLDLSQRRSAAVKQALTTRYKVGLNRLQTSGYGESRPKDRNDTMEGRARNRRVELVKG